VEGGDRTIELGEWLGYDGRGMGRTYKLLVAIFVLGLGLRLVYFPQSVYFGNDQARDAYYSYEVIRGDLKIVGPGSSYSSNIHHGVLYYYLMGPIYYLAHGSPFVPALVVSLFSTLGIFVVFFVARDLFDSEVGLIAAVLYAISFEQTQYAMFFSHPGMALIFVLLYYLGLTRLIFKGDSRGLILAAMCAGVATQFHFSLVILILFLPLYIVLFRPEKRTIKFRDVILALGALALSMSTFAVAEIKFGHLRVFASSLGEGGGGGLGVHIGNFVYAVNRNVSDNLIGMAWKPVFGFFVAVAIFGLLVWKGKERKAGLFLVMWFLTGCVFYILGDATTYYLGIGGSVSLLIAAAWVIWKQRRSVVMVLLAVVVASNLYRVFTVNSGGPIDSVMAPVGLMLTDEVAAIDYIYSQGGEDFSVHGLTIPYNVKTTWDYLFNWYGKRRYGFVPVWGGQDALGSEGTMKVVSARSELPVRQFLIIEPLVGLPDKVVDDFMIEEGYFTHLKSEKKFGEITVQVREKY